VKGGDATPHDLDRAIAEAPTALRLDEDLAGLRLHRPALAVARSGGVDRPEARFSRHPLGVEPFYNKIGLVFKEVKHGLHFIGESALKVKRWPKDTIAAGYRHTVGLKSDGTVAVVG